MSLAILWRVLIWVWVASEIVIAFGTRAKSGSASVRDRGSLAILWMVITTACLAAGWLGEVRFARIPISSPTAKMVGIVVLVAGLALRWTAVLTLGKFFTSNVAIHEGQTVLRTGVYRYLRHPSYTGLWLAFAGLAFHYRDWVSLFVVLLPITAAMLYRIRVEEAALVGAFGTEYEDYRKTTSRLIPRLY
jgi:protein-S-isoprenylcysteine O-methyltransferase Ste14